MQDNFYIMQGDSLPLLSRIISDESGPIDLTGRAVTWKMSLVADPTVTVTGTATPDANQTANKGLVVYTWGTTDTLQDGLYYGNFIVDYGSGRVLHAPNFEYIAVNVIEAR